jgi:hypothetical protein
MRPVELQESELLDKLYSEQKLNKISVMLVCNVYAEKWVQFYNLFR